MHLLGVKKQYGWPKRIAFVIYGMELGGAQRQLLLLALGLQAQGYECSVVVWHPSKAGEEALAKGGVHVIRVKEGPRRWWGLPMLFWRVAQAVSQQRAEIIHGYLTAGNLASSVAGLFLPSAKVVWSVRGTSLAVMDRGLMLLSNLCRVFSRSTDMIISNSKAGAFDAVSSGYPAKRIRIIPNGIDTDSFRHSPLARMRLRSEWLVGQHEYVIGVLSRLDPMKGHEILIEAARCLLARRSDLRFVVAGEGNEPYRSWIIRLFRASGLGDRLLWIGETLHPSQFWSAVDVACSPSRYGEGFSNSIAEAMACGKACVVTDVGDSSSIVGSWGHVIEANDPIALAGAIENAISRLSPALAAQCRAHIVQNYSVGSMIEETISAYECLSP